jgi:uncharacterized protein
MPITPAPITATFFGAAFRDAMELGAAKWGAVAIGVLILVSSRNAVIALVPKTRRPVERCSRLKVPENASNLTGHSWCFADQERSIDELDHDHADPRNRLRTPMPRSTLGQTPRLLFVSGIMLGLAASSASAQDKGKLREAHCATRPTPTEQAICLDKTLVRRDGQLNEVYGELQRKIPAEHFNTVRNEQRQWLLERNRCGDNADCLRTAYEKRLAVLERALETAPKSATKLHPTCAGQGRLKSLNSNTPITITFVNKSKSYRGVMWLDFGGTPVTYINLNPGQSYTQKTFLTHPWMFTDGPGNCMEIYQPKSGDTRFEITAASPAFRSDED